MKRTHSITSSFSVVTRISHVSYLKQLVSQNGLNFFHINKGTGERAGAMFVSFTHIYVKAIGMRKRRPEHLI